MFTIQSCHRTYSLTFTIFDQYLGFGGQSFSNLSANTIKAAHTDLHTPPPGMKTQILTLCLFAARATAIWPLPVQFTSGQTFLWLSPNVTFNYLPANATNAVCFLPYDHLCLLTFGAQTNSAAPYANTTTYQNMNASSNIDSYAIVQSAVQYTMDELFNDDFVPWRFHLRNSTYEPPVDGSVGASVAYINQVNIYQNATDPVNALKSLAGGVNESYTIVITVDGQVNITAIHSVGIIRALETFSQMFFTTADGTGVYTNQAPVMISDYPMFPHRGLNMDVARNFFPVTDIIRTIDALAYNKFNRLHLHATDAQSWPLEIPALPNLAGMGAYQPGMTYSPDDLAQIQTYGAYRGVQVIIETDMPGHTASIAYSRPDLIAAFNVQPDWSTYGAEPPTGGLKLNSSAVYDFLGIMFNDILPRVYPYSAYFHTGGDEVNANVYLLDETVNSNSSTLLKTLLQQFVDFTHSKVRAAGLTPVVWEEMLLQWNLTLGSDVVVQTWQSDSAVANTVAQGHKALAGNYNYWVRFPNI